MAFTIVSSLCLCVIVLLVCSCCLSSSVDVSSDQPHLRLPSENVRNDVPKATPWPWEFTISFTTTSDRGTQEGFLAYDWANKRQRVWHSPGSYACLEYGTEQNCSTLFNPTGIFVIIPSEHNCWLETPGVGSVPPDWVVQGEYVGLQVFQGAGLCRGFAYPPTAHLYWERVEDGAPCYFAFSVAQKDYAFIPETLVLGPPHAEFFALPDYCSSTKQM